MTEQFKSSCRLIRIDLFIENTLHTYLLLVTNHRKILKIVYI